MQRRKFIKTAALSAVAISASGFIRFDGNRYAGTVKPLPTFLALFTDPAAR